MPDKPDSKELETVLARLQNEWQKLSDILKNQVQPQERVIEVEKILLRDASGKYRGKISANEDGSASLLLSDNEGNAWAWLGINQNGEAFFELKDRQGEISFKVPVGAPSPGAGAEPVAAPEPAASQPLESPIASSQPSPPAAGGGEPLDEPGFAPPPPVPDHHLHPGWDANSRVFDQLEKLDHQNRRQKFYRVLVMVVLAVLLATQAYVLLRSYLPGQAEEALVVRDPDGKIRASLEAAGGQVRVDLWDPQGRRRATLGLGSEGTPGLAFYDRDQRLRAELKLGDDGEPKFTLRDRASLQGHKELNVPDDSGNQQHRGVTVAGAEEDTAASRIEAVAPKPAPEAEVELVGSTTGKYYHYPTCKWAGAIARWKLIKFKSAAEAQARHLAPCPVCKPPPLSRQPSPAP
jgi:hypothetical protein